MEIKVVGGNENDVVDAENILAHGEAAAKPEPTTESQPRQESAAAVPLADEASISGKEEGQEWLNAFLEQVGQQAAQEQKPQGEGLDAAEEEPQVTLTPEEEEALKSLPQEVQDKVRAFQNSINARNAQKWRKIWAKAREAEAKAAALQEALRIASAKPSEQPQAKPFPAQQEAAARPALPIGEDGLPDTTLLPEFKALQEASPDEYYQRLMEYERASARALLRYMEERSRAAFEAEKRRSSVAEVDARLEREWTGDLLHPIPWSEVKALFEQDAQSDPSVYEAVASVRGTPEQRAHFMSAVVASRHPDLYAKRLAEAQRKLAAAAVASKQVPAAAQVIQGSGNGSAISSGKVDPNNKEQITKAWLAYINSRS